MNFSPSIYIRLATGFSAIAVGLSFMLSGLNMAVGVLISSVLLSLNLWGWVWMLGHTVSLMKHGGTNSIVTFFSAIKFLVLIASLFAIMFFFGGTVVAISNTVVVLALLMPTIYFEYQKRGVSNGC